MRSNLIIGPPTAALLVPSAARSASLHRWASPMPTVLRGRPPAPRSQPARHAHFPAAKPRLSASIIQGVYVLLQESVFLPSGSDFLVSWHSIRSGTEQSPEMTQC